MKETGREAADDPARVGEREAAVVCRIDIGADHPAFDGHFPGRPVLPGVALVAEVLEAALTDPRLTAHVGGVTCIEFVKFLAPIGPGAKLSIRFERSGEKGAARLDFVVRAADDRVAASGRLSCRAGDAAGAQAR